MNKDYDPNNWYDRHGVERPTHIPFLTEEELEKKFADLKASTKHGDWQQDGNVITCRKCPLRHSTSIPTQYLLKGTDEKGLPILEKM